MLNRAKKTKNIKEIFMKIKFLIENSFHLSDNFATKMIKRKLTNTQQKTGSKQKLDPKMSKKFE